MLQNRRTAAPMSARLPRCERAEVQQRWLPDDPYVARGAQGRRRARELVASAAGTVRVDRADLCADTADPRRRAYKLPNVNKTASP